MTIEQLRERIDEALRQADHGDPEAAHADEDAAMQAWIDRHAPDDVRAEFQRLWAADFPRWCA